MRILITGASGLLGVNLALEAARDHLVIGQINALHLNNAPFEQRSGDLLKPDAVKELVESSQPDWVIHCAALADIDACEKNPYLAEQLNAVLPGRFARACKNKAKIIYVSTDAVFDGTKEEYFETDVPNPLSVYAKTKLAGEQAVMENDPDAVIARINLFGWSLFGTRSLAEWFFYNLQAGNQVKGFTDVFFRPQLVNELAVIFLQILAQNLSGLYHVVGADCVSKYQFALEIAHRLKEPESMITPVKVQEFGLQAARSNHLNLSTSKLQKVIHTDIPGLSTGLDRLFTQYQQGYPQFLRNMVENSNQNLNPYTPGGKDGN
jgi:dTDP-4-dehydrorhamnose reductase